MNQNHKYSEQENIFISIDSLSVQNAVPLLKCIVLFNSLASLNIGNNRGNIEKKTIVNNKIEPFSAHT